MVPPPLNVSVEMFETHCLSVACVSRPASPVYHPWSSRVCRNLVRNLSDSCAEGEGGPLRVDFVFSAITDSTQSQHWRGVVSQRMLTSNGTALSPGFPGFPSCSRSFTCPRITPRPGEESHS